MNGLLIVCSSSGYDSHYNNSDDSISVSVDDTVEAAEAIEAITASSKPHNNDQSLLSPPDISLISISPGEDTLTMATPLATPPQCLAAPLDLSFTTIQAPKSHSKILREKKKNVPKASLNPNRASYPCVGSSSGVMTSDLVMSSSSTSSSGERLSGLGTDGKYCIFWPSIYFCSGAHIEPIDHEVNGIF